MTWPEFNALLNATEVLVLAILAARMTRLLNARKREIDQLHEEIHEKDELLEVRRQRIDLLERAEARRVRERHAREHAL
jgi:hypothetical protein